MLGIDLLLQLWCIFFSTLDNRVYGALDKSKIADRSEEGNNYFELEELSNNVFECQTYSEVTNPATHMQVRKIVFMWSQNWYCLESSLPSKQAGLLSVCMGLFSTQNMSLLPLPL